MRRPPPPSASDVILGTASPPYPHPQYRLSTADQAHHGLIWGATGTGKSRLLASLFLQHLNKGHGVCLIDPHSDLSLTCLGYLAERGFFNDDSGYRRLVYVDFGRGGHLPFNVLAGRDDPHTRALSAYEALTRAWPDLRTAPLFATLFLSCALTLIANDLPLTSINELLLDRDFRRQCLASVSDPLVHQALAYYERHGQGQAGSTLRRAFLLSFSPVTRGILGQHENTLDIRGMMDSGTSLIVNLGTIPDPVTRRLVGSLILVAIERAALSRIDQPTSARRPWTCLVDEWPSFSAARGETLENVLTQARKFGLRLYLAAQSVSQVSSDRLSGALENCRLSVTFRMGLASARAQAPHIADIDPHRVKEPPRTLGGRPTYFSASEQMAEWVALITSLPNRQALVSVQGHTTVPITALSVRDPEITDEALAAIAARYRTIYQTPAARVERSWRGAQMPPTADFPSDILSDDTIYERDAPTTDFNAFFGEDNPYTAGFSSNGS